MQWTCHHFGGSSSERYVWNSALDVPNCRLSFHFMCIHMFSIFWVTVLISGLFGLTKLASWIKIELKYLKNNLRRPFENCEFTPLLYRITKIISVALYNDTQMVDRYKAWKLNILNEIMCFYTESYCNEIKLFMHIFNSSQMMIA